MGDHQTATRDEIEALARGFYDARVTNDPARLMPLFAPCATLDLMGAAEASSFPVHCADANAIQPLAEAMTALWRFESVEILALLIDGPTAAAHARVTVTHAPSGAHVVTDMLDLMTFEDGLIVKFTEFADTAKVAQLLTAP